MCMAVAKWRVMISCAPVYSQLFSSHCLPQMYCICIFLSRQHRYTILNIHRFIAMHGYVMYMKRNSIPFMYFLEISSLELCRFDVNTKQATVLLYTKKRLVLLYCMQTVKQLQCFLVHVPSLGWSCPVQET